MSTTVAAEDTKVVRGIVLRRDPAREPCFEIVHLHQDVGDMGGMGPEHRRQRLHREYNQEVQSLEIAALCLVDFPDAPWELRLELARQCWDEARHTALIYGRLTASGGWKGEFPIANLDWALVAMIDSMPGRLAVQHRTFEAGSLDSESLAVPLFRGVGDDATADVTEAIEADEIQHVRFANAWLKRLADAEPRTLLQVARAMAWLKRVIAATGGDPLHPMATDRESRELAGFSRGDVAEVARLERQVAASLLRDMPANQRDE